MKNKARQMVKKAGRIPLPKPNQVHKQKTDNDRKQNKEALKQYDGEDIG